MGTDDTEADHVVSEEKHSLWTASNVLSVLTMGIGSVGYGYSANVIAPILGQSSILIDGSFN